MHHDPVSTAMLLGVISPTHDAWVERGNPSALPQSPGDSPEDLSAHDDDRCRSVARVPTIPWPSPSITSAAHGCGTPAATAVASIRVTS